MTALSESTLVVIPIFNGRESLPGMIARLRAAEPSVDILVVGNSPPDGIGELADEIAAAGKVDNNDKEHIYILYREGRGGLWGAYRTGFVWGFECSYKVLCGMDADGSHAPEQFHLLLEKFEDGVDVVIGSRYIPGDKIVNWPMSRQILSRGGSLYISLALGTGISDTIAGYRTYRRGVLETPDLGSTGKAAYLFQAGFAFEVVQAGFLVEEVPITFIEREYGESKMDGSFVKQSLPQVTKWGFKHCSQQVKNLGLRISRPTGHETKQRFRKQSNLKNCDPQSVTRFGPSSLAIKEKRAQIRSTTLSGPEFQRLTDGYRALKLEPNQPKS